MTRAGGFLVLWLFAVSGVSAQALVARGGAVTQSYVFAEPGRTGVERFELRAAPVSIGVAISQWLSFQASGAYARGAIVEVGGRRTERAGIADAEWSFTGTGLAGALTVRMVGTLPAERTGPQSLAAATLGEMVGGELLPFAIGRWNEGQMLGGDVALVVPAGPARLEVRSGFRNSQADVRLAGDSLRYRPGDQLHAGATIDAVVGGVGLLRLSFDVESLGDDVISRGSIFRPGTRLAANASYAFPLGDRASGLLYGGVHNEAAGNATSGGGLTDKERLAILATLPGVAASASRTMMFGGGALQLRGSQVSLFPEVEARLLRAAGGSCRRMDATDDAIEVRTAKCPPLEGWLYSAGGTAEITLVRGTGSREVVVAPTGRVHIGHAVVGEKSGVFGWEAGVTGRVGVSR